jgi:hypothetical protein
VEKKRRVILTWKKNFFFMMPKKVILKNMDSAKFENLKFFGGICNTDVVLGMQHLKGVY